MKAKLKRLVRRVATRAGIQLRRTNEYVALRRAQLNTDARLSGVKARVGLVGCGRQGSRIALAVKQLGWQVTDLFDQKAEAAESVRGSLWPDASAHATDDTFWSRAADMDIVAVASTAPSHFPVARRAVEAGVKAVFLEKPVTNRLADADRLIELASAAGCRIAVDHSRRYQESVFGVKRLLENGAIGAPRSIHIIVGRAGLAMHGTHMFDLARLLFDADIVRVRAELDEVLDPSHAGVAYEDRAGRCEARLSNGVRLTMDLSGDLSRRQLFFVVACDQGRLEVDEWLGKVRLVGRGERVWEVDYVALRTLDVAVGRVLLDLMQGKTPRCTIADGRAALEAAIACYVSGRQQSAWIDLPLTGAVLEEEFPFA